MAAFPKLPFILDGATGSWLLRLGMPGGACAETWILEHPEAIRQIQGAYADAGSDAVCAPTFGANRVNLRKHGVERSVAGVVRELVDLSREAVSGRCAVMGDISPTGLMIEPFGEMTPQGLLDIFKEQAEALCEAGVDMFAVETQMYRDEAEAAVKAVRSVSDKPVIVTFPCGPTGKNLWGEDLLEVMLEMQELGIDAFGINCCGDLELMAGVLAALKDRAKLPLVAKPNAGLPEMEGGKAVYGLTPAEMAAFVPRFAECGVRIFGGCCGTDESHIRAISEAVGKL